MTDQNATTMPELPLLTGHRKYGRRASQAAQYPDGRNVEKVWKRALEREDQLSAAIRRAEDAELLTSERLSKIAELEEENRRMREALSEAARTFRRYEALHRAKPDHVKADANSDFAKMCEFALAPAESEATGA